MIEYLGLGAATETVYRAMLARPSCGVADLAEELGWSTDDIRAALDELFDLELLRQSAERAGTLRPVSPQVGLRAVLARQQAELAARQQRIAESQASLAAVLPETAGTAAENRPIMGMDAILQRLEELSSQTRVEALSVIPGGAMSRPSLDAGYRNNAELLDRGVTIRTTMQDSARNDGSTLDYAQSLTDAGAEVRTAPMLPLRLLVFDRKTAIVPYDPERTAAGVVELTGQGAVNAVLSLFEQTWQVAVPLGATRDRDRQGLTGQERELLKLLADGYTDGSAAKRLSISERSCRRIMSGLMERLGARSRFEAGLLAAREGWL